MLSWVLGWDMCASIPNFLHLSAFVTAIMFPLLQPVRLKLSIVLTLVDAVGLGCYTVFQTGSFAAGLAAFAAGSAAGVVVAAVVDARSRTLFLQSLAR